MEHGWGQKDVQSCCSLVGTTSELKENGEVEITDLKVGNYICNKKNNLKEECIKIE